MRGLCVGQRSDPTSDDRCGRATPRPRTARSASPQGGLLLLTLRRTAHKAPGQRPTGAKGGHDRREGGDRGKSLCAAGYKHEDIDSAASRIAEPPQLLFFSADADAKCHPPKGGGRAAANPKHKSAVRRRPHPQRPRQSSRGGIRGGDPRGGPRRGVFRAVLIDSPTAGASTGLFPRRAFAAG